MGLRCAAGGAAEGTLPDCPPQGSGRVDPITCEGEGNCEGPELAMGPLKTPQLSNELVLHGPAAGCAGFKVLNRQILSAC